MKKRLLSLLLAVMMLVSAMPFAFSPSRMAAMQSAALARMAAEERPSPTTICTVGGLGTDFLMISWCFLSKLRPKSGRVRY